MRVDTLVLHRFSLRAMLATLLAGAALALTGCASLRSEPPAAPVTEAGTVKATQLKKFLWVFSPYRPNIQQGNFISKEMLAQVEVGQTREQVKFILGTPLLTDIFHADRWDYPFYLARGNGDLTSAKVVVHFKDDKVARVEGGSLPSEQEYIAQIAGPPRKAATQAPKKEAVGAAAITINK